LVGGNDGAQVQHLQAGTCITQPHIWPRTLWLVGAGCAVTGAARLAEEPSVIAGE
jgi:hypothetical protein